MMSAVASVMPISRLGFSRSAGVLPVDPNRIQESFPTLQLGRNFDVYAPLVANQPLAWHVQWALWPIGLYHSLTRHNARWGKTVAKQGHVPCLFPDRLGRLSCSEYTAMAIKVMGQREGVWGSLKGWMYGLGRIARCNPLTWWRIEHHRSVRPDAIWA
ncbi:MAG: hypothetical protein U0003_02680 [Vampirovibrionales bacterium]